MTIGTMANRAKRVVALAALIAFCALLLAPGANAAAAKRLSLDDIVGDYIYADTDEGYTNWTSFEKEGNKLVEVFENGGKTYRAEYKYNPATGVATMYEHEYIVTQTLTFARVGEAIGYSTEETTHDPDDPSGAFRYFGFKLPEAEAEIPIDEIVGTYEYQGPGSKVVHRMEMVRSGNKLIARWEDGGENVYDYDPEFAEADKLTKGKNNRFVLTAWSFSKNDGVMEVFIQESDIIRNKSCTLSTFRGQKINLVGSGGPAAEFSTEALPKLADFQWYINDIQKTGSPQNLKGVKHIKDFELIKGGWKGIVFDNDANLAKSGYISTFNLEISGSEKSVKLTPDWYRDYNSFNEKDVRGDASDTEPFEGRWTVGRDYGFVKAEDSGGDNALTVAMFYELNGKQYALGILTWWDGWETYVALVRP